MDLIILVRALLFGVTLAIAIGPIALLIIRYAATEGFGVGLASACGAALADFTYALIALSVGTLIAPGLTAHSTQVHLVSAFALVAFGLWLVWMALRPTPQTSRVTEPLTTPHRRWAPLITTYALTAANPLTVIAFFAFIGQLPLNATMTVRAMAAVGLFLGSLCVQVGLALGGVALGRVLAARRGIQALNLLSGVGILLFGLGGLWR